MFRRLLVGTILVLAFAWGDLEVTPEHPFYVVHGQALEARDITGLHAGHDRHDAGALVKAGELQPGDRIESQRATQEFLAIRTRQTREWVYNFEVAKELLPTFEQAVRPLKWLDRSKGHGMPKNVVQIRALDSHSTEVASAELGVNDYYENLHPLIDDANLRLALGVRQIAGQVFDECGEVLCEMEASFDEFGRRTADTVRYTTGEMFKHRYDPETGLEVE